jgi:hypothetical protein
MVIVVPVIFDGFAATSGCPAAALSTRAGEADGDAQGFCAGPVVWLARGLGETLALGGVLGFVETLGLGAGDVPVALGEGLGESDARTPITPPMIWPSTPGSGLADADGDAAAGDAAAGTCGAPVVGLAFGDGSRVARGGLYVADLVGRGQAAAAYAGSDPFIATMIPATSSRGTIVTASSPALPVGSPSRHDSRGAGARRGSVAPVSPV